MLKNKKIKPLRPKQQDADQQWESLSSGMIQMFNRNHSHLSFEQLYRNSYNLVLMKYGSKLYQGTREIISNWLDGALQDLPTEPEPFLKKFTSIWDDHCTSIEMARDILMYLDRTWVKQQNLPSVYEMGLDAFKDSLFKFELDQRLLESCLCFIDMERRGQITDRILLKNTTRIYYSLEKQSKTLYQVLFEPAHLLETANFYGNNSCPQTCPEYLEYTKRRLDLETELTLHCLVPESLPKVLEQLRSKLLKEKLAQIIEMDQGLIYLLDNQKFDQLKLLLELFLDVDGGLQIVKQHLYDHVYKLGIEIPTNHEDKKEAPLLWVEEVVKLANYYNEILKFGFLSNKQLEIAVNTALQVVVNSNQRAPEYVALYVDSCLKKAAKGTAIDFDDSALMIFKFLEEKDVFEGYYKQNLAKRLLSMKNINEDAEKNMISKIKLECGSIFTSKLEGMFNDVNLSKDLNAEFKSDQMQVSVLTQTFWPSTMTKLDSLPLPKNMQALCEKFSIFYHLKHTGRKLVYLTSLGTVDLRVNFPLGKKEINVSTLAMIVLLQVFNDQTEASCIEIAKKTGMPEHDLHRTLQSLSLGKYKILLKSTKQKQILNTDTFTFNTNFECPLVKIKIQQVASGVVENDSERQDTLKKVEEMRRHQVEACIVRIMKSRKTLNHMELTTQVLEQMGSRFQASPSLIKSRIESLIEREYLKRDENDRLFKFMIGTSLVILHD